MRTTSGTARGLVGRGVALVGVALVGVVGLSGLPGCVVPRPVPTREVQVGALGEIVSVYAARVRELRRGGRGQPIWHAGWTGNVAVNEWGGDRRGLCYHWQDEVARTIGPTVDRVGWKAVGVHVNVGTEHEHHAVAVFDPRVVRADRVLQSGSSVWVLDPWRRGEPDVYRLAEWLELPAWDLTPAGVEPLRGLERGGPEGGGLGGGAGVVGGRGG